MAARTAGVNPRRIDVHAHCFPSEWFARKREFVLGAAAAAASVMTEWSPERALELMDRNKIAATIVSIANPGVWFGDFSEARELQRSCNEYMAGLARKFPGRFGVFAALAIPDVEGSLAEIAYAFDQLHVDGVQMLTSYDLQWLGDPKFEPIFAELNQRKAVVFVHPTAPEPCKAFKTGAPPSILEFPFDEARAVASLVLGGTVSKYRDIKFIFTHAGGPVPVIAERMGQMTRYSDVATRVPEGIVAALKTLYFDVANSTVNRAAMAAVMTFARPDHLLFGSDFPYVDMHGTIGGFDRLDLPAEAVAGINRDNAVKIFPRLA